MKNVYWKLSAAVTPCLHSTVVQLISYRVPLLNSKAPIRLAESGVADVELLRGHGTKPMKEFLDGHSAQPYIVYCLGVNPLGYNERDPHCEVSLITEAFIPLGCDITRSK